MGNIKSRHLAHGTIQNRIDSSWYSYEMRTLNQNDLPDVLELYNIVINNLTNKNFLWRYTDEMVALFLTNKAVAAGVVVNKRLVGVRVLYFHDLDDKENPLVDLDFPYKITADSALSIVHPDFRGNSLQRKMGLNILKMAQEDGAFENFCSVVAPGNYASIKDKFSLDMVVVKLLPKFSGLWRYVFYRNMNQSWEIDKADIIFVASNDYSQQIKLLEQGYYGFRLAEDKGVIGLCFGKRKL